jgi:signal transduction histidine kinase/CheY-like chemotaxis protein
VKTRAGQLAASRTPSALPASRVDEVTQALEALDQASETLQAATRARDQSLETEQKARAAAEAANQAKDEFLAMLGHELRNPLAAIWSAVAVVRSDRHTREQLDFAAGVIERQSRHLKRLIDDLLDVGRVINGKVMLERAPLDLAAAARYVVATLESAGRFAQRRLELDTEPAWVDADHTRLEQIITNLVINAVTYSAAGGRVKVRVARQGNEAVLEVSDDGRGIAPKHLERVFELFFQGDSTVERASGGLGIGLTLVQRLVEMHGGQVSARSAGPGHGASFEVRLPAVQAGAQPALAAVPPRPAAAHEILLVEDNHDERETLRVALELEGHRVLRASDGVAALELLLRHRPPVAILDIGLPGMDGYQLARQARAAMGPRLMLIALTGYGGALDVQRAKQVGFDCHLTKPVDVRELVQAIARNQRGLSADQKIA